MIEKQPTELPCNRMVLHQASGIYRHHVYGEWQMENEELTYRIFTAEHESNLATGISWDGAVGVVHHRE